MTIADEIEKLQSNLSDSYTACQGKGATMPADENFDNLANCIDSIQTGTTPTLVTKSITQNGTYNASSDNADGYSSVTVNVPSSGGIGITREISANGVFQMPATSFTFSLPSNATDLGLRTLYYAFYNCSTTTTVDLSSLTNISGNSALAYAFYNNSNLEDLDMSNVVTISGNNVFDNAFRACGKLESVDLSKLTTISGGQTLYYAFYYCTLLENLDLSNLTTITTGSTTNSQTLYGAFTNCSSLTSVDLSSLTTVSGNNAMQNAFQQCTGLTSVLFTNLETIGANNSSNNYGQLSYCFSGCTNLTSITFPKLEKIYCTGGTSTQYGTFANNNKVQKMYFPKLDTITYGSGASSTNRNACKNVFYGCSALTELHFGAANRSAIEASSGYSTAWGRGAGNVTIYFDL